MAWTQIYKVLGLLVSKMYRDLASDNIPYIDGVRRNGSGGVLKLGRLVFLLAEVSQKREAIAWQ